MSLKASPKSAEGVTIKTDFTVEGELSKNFAGEGNYAQTAIADNGRPEATTRCVRSPDYVWQCSTSTGVKDTGYGNNARYKTTVEGQMPPA